MNYRNIINTIFEADYDDNLDYNPRYEGYWFQGVRRWTGDCVLLPNIYYWIRLKNESYNHSICKFIKREGNLMVFESKFKNHPTEPEPNDIILHVHCFYAYESDEVISQSYVQQAMRQARQEEQRQEQIRIPPEEKLHRTRKAEECSICFTKTTFVTKTCFESSKSRHYVCKTCVNQICICPLCRKSL